MTTVSASTKQAAVLFQGLIAIDKIDLGDNFRKDFDKAYLNELTESIRSRGVDTPILLRPNPNGYGRYLLVAGACRLRASVAAKLTQIPAMVKDWSEDQALVSHAIENLQRKGLKPIEEARGLKLMIDRNGSTIDELAKLIDKSISYVTRAVRLLELPKEAVDKIEAGVITPAHGHELLRVPPFEREALLKEVLENGYDGRIMPAVELRDHVEQTLSSDLSEAKFVKDKPYAGMDACNGCPSNTSNQTALFDEAVKGICTNKKCFTTKEKQLKADFLDASKLAHLDAAFVEYAKGWVGEGYNRTGGWSVKEKLTTKNAKGNYGVVIGLDRTLWLAVQAKESERAPAAAPYDWEKDHFVRNAVSEALIKAEAEEALKLKAGRKVYEEVALNLLRRNGHQQFATALGLEKLVVSKLTDDQLAAAMVWCARDNGWHPKKRQIETEAKKQALADYKAKKAAKSATKGE